MLGTFITEGKHKTQTQTIAQTRTTNTNTKGWQNGEEEQEFLLESPQRTQQIIKQLVRVAKYYGFDGWFVNLESKLRPEKVSQLIDFLRDLRELLQKEIGSHAQVIWYDSVTVGGVLKWQNALNEHNKAFFDVCDGIFLNYNWNPEILKSTLALAGDRRYDVFVGIDVWGRGTYGGGEFKTYTAIQQIQAHGLSIAIFAPGWTFEKNESSRIGFELREEWFWRGTGFIELLRNGSGKEKFHHWKIVENGGQGFSLRK